MIYEKTLMTRNDNKQWIKIAEHVNEIHFNTSGLAEWSGAGKKLCIVKQGDEIHACSAKCPHAGGNLAEGYLDALGQLVCPLHRYKFNITNGRNVSGEGYFLKVYPVEIREDGLFIGF